MHAFRVSTRRNLCLLLLCAAVAGCRPTEPLAVVGVTPTTKAINLTLDDAQRTAADFLNAWVEDGYLSMYNLLTLNSRDATPFETFERSYRATAKTMTTQKLQYSLANAIQQNGVAQIAYDITFQTQLFGEISDTNRVLALVAAPDGWRVAWTPGDILAEFKDGGFLDVERTVPNRGNIYGRDGDVIADQNGQVLVGTMYTKEFPAGPDACYAALAQVYGKRTPEQIKAAYGRFASLDYAFEVGTLSGEKMALARPLLDAACTMKYTTRPTRRYVASGLAPHVVGYVGVVPAERVDEFVARGYPPDALVGIDGIERFYEETLAGRSGARLLVYAANGKLVRTLGERTATPSQSVYLTLDRRLQEATQNALKEAFSFAVWGPAANGAAAVVLDVNTGKILAIASYPDFDIDAFNPNTSLPNAQALIKQWSEDPRKPTFNRATLGLYPPGSVFKIISMAAAADSGIFSLNTPIFCNGVWNGRPLGDTRRTDWLQGGHGRVTLKQALTGSCNIYFWNVGWTLNGRDPNLLINYAKRMGLGAKTGLDAIAEDAGALPDPAVKERIEGIPWNGSDALNAVIGQAYVQVTPLQIARMVAAVANGGTLYQPLLVDRVGLIGDYSYEAQPVAQANLGIKPEILAGVREAMCDVTTDPTLGTARFIFKDFSGAAVCGKTGTAENGPGRQTTAWFAAFAGRTADKPEIAIAVVVDRGGQGSYIAAPIVRRIVESYYSLNVAPWPAWYGDAAYLPVPVPDAAPLE